jgi:hypothetical protein
MQELVRRGVRPPQLATVAIGKSQPRAPNDTEEGRALNRRVEFMISANQDANVTLVQRRRINEDFFRLNSSDVPIPTVPVHVEVYRLTPTTEIVSKPDDLRLQRPSSEGTPIKPVNEKEPTLQPVREIELQKPAPDEFRLTRTTEYQQNKLNEEFKLD